MELEQRVKVLEQEVKILKNQIQTTLLDIQEQLLVSKYPALRAEDNNVSQAASAAQEWQSDAGPEVPAPIIHKVMLTETPAQTDDARVEVDAPPTPGSSDWGDLVRLNDWAVATVDRVGVERAQMLIMMYARRGLLTAEVEESLLEAVEMYGSANGSVPGSAYAASANQIVEQEAASAPQQFVSEEDGESPKAERNLIMRLIKGLQNGKREVNRG